MNDIFQLIANVESSILLIPRQTFPEELLGQKNHSRKSLEFWVAPGRIIRATEAIVLAMLSPSTTAWTQIEIKKDWSSSLVLYFAVNHCSWESEECIPLYGINQYALFVLL